MIKIAINGFGRIGRAVFRILADHPEMQVVGINDISPAKSLVYLLKYDTVMGRFAQDVALDGDQVTCDGKATRISQIRSPAELPWGELGVDIVIEATGRFRQRQEIEQHLKAGAQRVILTVPAKDRLDATIVLGVNDDELKPEHRLLSNASCTTNCLAPLAKVLDDRFGIEKGLITTVHAYTNDQRLADWYHADPRRSRAAGENTIPTTTGAARAVGQVLPQLAGKLDGMAMRVPVPDGSIVDLVVQLRKPADSETVNAALREAADGPMQGILQYSTEALVSTDIVGNPHSCIFDAPLTQALSNGMLKVFAWYDNEWGYANRVVDLAQRAATL